MRRGSHTAISGGESFIMAQGVILKYNLKFTPNSDMINA